MSHEVCVCMRPSSPESQVAIDGMSLVLVQVQISTAPISAGRRPDFARAFLAASRAMSSSGNWVYRRSSIPVFSLISAALMRDQQ